MVVQRRSKSSSNNKNNSIGSNSQKDAVYQYQQATKRQFDVSQAENGERRNNHTSSPQNAEKVIVVEELECLKTHRQSTPVNQQHHTLSCSNYFSPTPNISYVASSAYNNSSPSSSSASTIHCYDQSYLTSPGVIDDINIHNNTLVNIVGASPYPLIVNSGSDTLADASHHIFTTSNDFAYRPSSTTSATALSANTNGVCYVGYDAVYPSYYQVCFVLVFPIKSLVYKTLKRL